MNLIINEELATDIAEVDNSHKVLPQLENLFRNVAQNYQRLQRDKVKDSGDTVFINHQDHAGNFFWVPKENAKEKFELLVNFGLTPDNGILSNQLFNIFW